MHLKIEIGQNQKFFKIWDQNFYQQNQNFDAQIFTEKYFFTEITFSAFKQKMGILHKFMQNQYRGGIANLYT